MNIEDMFRLTVLAIVEGSNHPDAKESLSLLIASKRPILENLDLYKQGLLTSEEINERYERLKSK